MSSINIFFILTLIVLSSSHTLIYKSAFLDQSEIIHENSKLGKVHLLEDGSNIIISQKTVAPNKDKTLISKLGEDGNFIYKEKDLDLIYSINTVFTDSKISTGEKGYTIYYKQNGKEYLTQFNEDWIREEKSAELRSYNFITSLINLKNGKVFFAGITKPGADFVQTKISINIFYPQTKAVNGKTLDAYSQYISCAELKDNEVFCAYVKKEDILRSLLKIQHFKISSDGSITPSEPMLIKSFFTQFNSLKVVKISQNKLGILFQTGDTKYLEDIPYGNSGKDLFFYELEVSSDSFEVLRYDYLFNNCRYVRDDSDCEDYSLDIISPFENSIYAICEIDNNGKDSIQFELFEIGEPDKKVIRSVFNGKDNPKGIRNPSLVKMGNSIGVLYTRIDKNDKNDVMLKMMNYPDCEEVDKKLKIVSQCKNKDQKNSLNGFFNIFIRNPYPSSMSSTPLFFRIINSNGIKIFNADTELELNQDYSTSIIHSLTVNDFINTEKNSYIEYKVSLKKSEEKIFGKICKIQINSPICNPHCLGCDEDSTEEDHKCFDCEEGYYSHETKEDTTGCGKNGKLYNCNPCDIACKKCYGPFDKKIPTTNCKEHQCNYEENYFPYLGNNKTCINEQNKTFWEENLKCVLYLDKTKGNNKQDWYWNCCHKKCGSCHLAGTDENNNCDTCKKNEYYFFSNQTIENGLIPGNCHDSCIGDGCYLCEDKMCPCLPHCKVCKDSLTCDECREKWLLPPEKTSCDENCSFCLTPLWEDENKKTNGKCINCAEYYDPPRYTYNNKCYKKEDIPTFKYKEYNSNSEIDFNEVIKKYHVNNTKCNLLTACKKGCHNCLKEKTDQCTECEENYYMEDPFNVKRPWFRCFTKRVCRGNDQYPHDHTLRIGGVDIFEEGKLVCLNCKQRNESFRWPEENYFCGPNLTSTFVDIPDYNKLTKCYIRCKTCDSVGNACQMECLSCRDSAFYDLIKYNQHHGQCYRKQHKCGIYPYYHNYELAIDEDNCGEACDVCLYNFQCPKEFPFFKFETHECVEFCPFTDVLGGACNVNISIAAIILLRNPLGLRNPYDYINRTITMHEIFQSSFFQYIVSVYPEFVNVKSHEIFNYIGKGKVYNLPQSHFIIGNNISIELTSVRLELEKIINYTKGIIPNEPLNPKEPKENPPVIEHPSAVNLSECQKILKKKYSLPEEEDLVILKSDTLNEFNLTDIIGIETDYILFSITLGAFLPLNSCKEGGTSIEVTNPVNEGYYSLLSQTNSKTVSVLANDYDIFDANSPFYNDVCTPYTNENGNDVLLDDRRKDYYNEYNNICDKGCTIVGYNAGAKTYTCRCNLKATPGENTGDYNGEIIERKIPDDFLDLISRRSNIEVFKCASNVFSAKGQRNNFGSYILLALFAAFVGVLVFHFVKEKNKAMDLTYEDLANISNPPKNGENEDKKEQKENKKNKKGKKNKVTTVNEQREIDYGDLNPKAKPEMKKSERGLVYSDYELNFVPYDEAFSKDNRSFLKIYWGMLKFKQIFLFTFIEQTRGILRSSKIVLLILFFAFYMAFTALFFNDDIMRALYLYKGNTNAAVHVPNIILSSICSFIATLIVRYVSLNEKKISNVYTIGNKDDRKKLAKEIKKSSNIKLIILYCLSAILILLCWYYVSAFCAIFKNSQKNYLINFFACFIICNLWPFVTCLIPAFMRKKAIKNKSSCLYKASQIVSIF